MQAVDLFPYVDQSVIENCLPFNLTHFAWSDVMRGRQSNTGDERRIEDLFIICVLKNDIFIMCVCYGVRECSCCVFVGASPSLLANDGPSKL